MPSCSCLRRELVSYCVAWERWDLRRCVRSKFKSCQAANTSAQKAQIECRDNSHHIIHNSSRSSRSSRLRCRGLWLRSRILFRVANSHSILGARFRGVPLLASLSTPPAQVGWVEPMQHPTDNMMSLAEPAVTTALRSGYDESLIRP